MNFFWDCLLIQIIFTKTFDIVSGKARQFQNRFQLDLNHRFQNEKSVDSLSENTQEDEVVNELLACSLKNMIIYQENNTNLKQLQHFIGKFRSRHFPIAHLEIDNRRNNSKEIEDSIWDLYTRKGQTNFMWISNQPKMIIEIADRVYDRGKRKATGLMPNRAHFFIVYPLSNISSLQMMFAKVIFDHVVLYIPHQNPTLPHEVYTLLWKSSRNRSFEKIPSLRIDSSSSGSCRFFPNLKFGLNGRTLTGLAKEWLPYLRKEQDQNTGRLKYVGFAVDFIQILAESLNFTLVLRPKPGDDDNISWGDFIEVIERGEVDFSICFYYINGVLDRNVSPSFPIMGSNFTGVYVNRHHITPFRLSVFQNDVYLVIAGSLLLSVAFYLLISNMVEKRLENTGPISEAYETDTRTCGSLCQETEFNQQRYENIGKGLTYKRDLSRPTNIDVKLDHHKCGQGRAEVYETMQHGETETVRNSERNINVSDQDSGLSIDNKQENLASDIDLSVQHKCCVNCVNTRSSWSEILDIFFQFIGSLFGQGNLSSPNSLSARLFLWSWCITMIIVAATFTGNLTADLIGSDDVLPFTTFEEMMADGTYKWGLVNDSSILTVLKKSKPGSVLRRLLVGMENFAKDDPAIMGSFQESIVKLQTEKFVSLVDGFSLRYLKGILNIQHLVVLRNSFLTSDPGVIFPQDSELCELFSDKIVSMFESGITLQLFERSKAHVYPDEKDLELEVDHGTVDVDFISGALVLCGVGVGAALLVLVLEVLVDKIDFFSFAKQRHKTKLTASVYEYEVNS